MKYCDMITPFCIVFNYCFECLLHGYVSCHSRATAVGYINPIRSGGGGFKSPPLRFVALTHLILELHYCALVTFPKK